MAKLLIASLLTLMACSPDPTPPAPKVAPDPANVSTEPVVANIDRPARPAGDVIKFDAPAGWTKEEPSNNMRKAQYKVPDKEKKGGDAQLALVYFGPRNDALEDNLKRWPRRWAQPIPRPR